VRELGDAAARFGVDSTPALLLVCNGDTATAEGYKGEFKSGAIRDFLSKYAGGRKCASAVKVGHLTSSCTIGEPVVHMSPIV
jgi:hypothetical protein